MGTRSLTVFKDGHTEIAVLYNHWDGDPTSYGKKLAEFLCGITIVNGIPSEDMKLANGIGCLAAQVVANFKTKPGSFYLNPPGTRGVWEEYIYTIRGYVGDTPMLMVHDVESGDIIFDGSPVDFLESVENGLFDDDSDL